MPAYNQLDGDAATKGTAVELDEWEDGEGDAEGDLDYEEEGDEDDGADAEAEEIARRLGDQLWADINKAQADRAGAVSAPESTNDAMPHSLSPFFKQLQPSTQPVIQLPPQHASKREESAIATIKAILSHAAKDALVLSIFSSTVIPECHGQNILNVFNRIVLDGTISKDIARPLSNLCLSLARSETLFSQSSMQPDKGKRKRNENDESDDPRFPKKPSYTPSDLASQIAGAVRVITEALSSHPSPGAMNPALISSIQLQLHQIFLFAVTSSAAGGPEMHALQELSGLIQVIGVLSGIQISSTPLGAPHDPKSIPFASNQFISNNDNDTPWLNPASSLPLSGASPDIGTAVYPCLIPSCRKVFSRLYSLRAHQRLHSVHRPFHCSSCPASFARNHDLKRHAKLHDKRAWKCGGCNKIFSRRDAIKRHKKTSRTRGNKGDACPDAEVMEVDLANQDESIKEGRRAKMWNGTAGSGTSGAGDYGEDRTLEEGEVDGGVISRAQVAVLGLHALLQTHVASNLGLPPGSSSQDLDPTAGQATLASVIARAQWQNPSSKEASLPKPDGHPSESTATVGGSRPSQHQSSQIPGPNGPDQASMEGHTTAIASLSRYGLSEEQTRMLEQAIANAASAAHAQAEAEAALEEEEEGEDVDDMINEDGDDGDGEQQA